MSIEEQFIQSEFRQLISYIKSKDIQQCRKLLLTPNGGNFSHYLNFYSHFSADLITMKDGRGATPLHWSALYGTLDICKLFFEFLDEVFVVFKNHSCSRFSHIMEECIVGFK